MTRQSDAAIVRRTPRIFVANYTRDLLAYRPGCMVYQSILLITSSSYLHSWCHRNRRKIYDGYFGGLLSIRIRVTPTS